MRRGFLAAAVLAAALLGTAGFAAIAGAKQSDEPTLLGRAILPSNAYQPGPMSGSALTGDLNGVSIPFPSQPIPGFSAVLDAGHDEFWAMPDNGYGAKTNSADFLLRLYRIRPDFETAAGGSGAVHVLSFLQLRDPDSNVPFALTRADRLLTGADFDLEGVRRAKDGTFWFGEELGRSCSIQTRRARCSKRRSRCPAFNLRRIRSSAAELRTSQGAEGSSRSP